MPSYRMLHMDCKAATKMFVAWSLHLKHHMDCKVAMKMFDMWSSSFDLDFGYTVRNSLLFVVLFVVDLLWLCFERFL